MTVVPNLEVRLANYTLKICVSYLLVKKGALHFLRQGLAGSPGWPGTCDLPATNLSPSTWEGETGGSSRVYGQLQNETLSPNKFFKKMKEDTALSVSPLCTQAKFRFKFTQMTVCHFCSVFFPI